MPELPDVTVYIERLEVFVVGKTLETVRLGSPFLVRSVEPKLDACFGMKVTGTRRMGKRIVFELEDALYMVIHLMIAGRLRWKDKGQKLPGKRGVAAFDFADGTLMFTEASTKKRASLYVVRGEENLAPFERGGLDVFSASHEEFRAAMRLENHTMKRSLTDPRILDGIGNAYSDEILHAARISPMKLSQKLSDEDLDRLHDACKQVLQLWIDRTRAEVGDGFPDKVTAFREGMVAHGRYKQPCPVCNKPIQRIRYAANETNYCAQCQNEGRLLADRGLSRLLKKDWPRSLEEMEELKLSIRAD